MSDRTTWVWGGTHGTIPRVTGLWPDAEPPVTHDEPPHLRYAGIPDVHKELRGRPDRPAGTAGPATLATDTGAALLDARLGSPAGQPATRRRPLAAPDPA